MESSTTVFDIAGKSLQCTFCSKRLRDEVTRDRHILRCSKRPKERKKACTECSMAKARCNQDLPVCQRCSLRGLQCTYAGNNLKRNPYKNKEFERADGPSKTELALDSGISDNMQGDQPTGQNFDILFTSITAGPSHVDWITPVWEDFLWAQSANHPSNPPNTVIGPVATPKGTFHMGNNILFAGNVRILEQMMLRFPQMLLDPQTPPPFIHHSTFEQPVCEPMASAILVARMYVAKTPGTSQFIRQTIDQQLLRIQGEYLHYDRRQILAMLQAVALYNLMIIFENDHDPMYPIDPLSKEIYQNIIPPVRAYVDLCPEPTTWHEWVFLESIRRVMFFCHIITYVSHARCSMSTFVCPHLMELPLSSRGKLWRASSEQDWLKEVSKSKGIPQVPQFKDLLAWSCGDKGEMNEALSEWMQDLDSLGSMIISSSIVSLV